MQSFDQTIKASKLITDTESAQKVLYVIGDRLHNEIQVADLANNSDKAYHLRCREVIVTSLNDIVNTGDTFLNPAQAKHLIEAIDNLAWRNLNDEKGPRTSCLYEYGKEIRELATWVNSCRG